MNGSHVAGGTLGLLIGYVAAHFGWNVSQDEALAFGAMFAMIGGSIAHLFQPPGLIPRIKTALGVAKSEPAKASPTEEPSA